MASPLEKALQAPSSMKARILASARRLFGENGFSDTTTRMIARDVSIDVSTLHYHWGEKQDLYEGVIGAVHAEIMERFQEVERRCRDVDLARRLEIAIDIMCDYLFEHPEVANLILFGYFRKADHTAVLDINISQYITNIAVAMELAPTPETVSVRDRARILAVWHSVLNFIAGRNYFRPMLDVAPVPYVRVVKETLKFILVPAFTAETQASRKS
ncbi:MAG: TetR/AcrR family transcriptional regulator [Desulfobacterales bacterium]|nr:TetR/AcrR family transcriptional regulator [Desulfobacterales bacterium]